MNNVKELYQLIVPIYINEKIVIDMLAIIEDGFSKVSQINYVEHKVDDTSKGIYANVGLPNIFGNLFRIDLKSDVSNSRKTDENESIKKDKVHTNASLLSKFRSYLVSKNILKLEFNVEQMNVGDFVEITGTLQKNPLIDCLDKIVDVFKMANIFNDSVPINNKTPKGAKIAQTTGQQQVQKLISQIKSFSDELKHSGTIDFILTGAQGTIVLSAQERYLANDNISEIIGGNFKVLGKVIAICKDESDNIDLLRKTTLSLLPENILEQMFSSFKSMENSQFNLPEFRTKIKGPALIVIPIAIYA